MCLGVGATLLGMCSTANAWGDKEKEPEMPLGKDALDLARAGFRQAAGDVGMLNDLLKDLHDPEMLKEVEKLMKDKDFKKGVESYLGSDEWKDGAADAMKFLSDPDMMTAMKKQSDEYMGYLAKGPGKDGKRDAAMGLEAASKGMQDPGFLADAMEMMNDPAVMKQVQETMNNPEFQKQMQDIVEMPAMKQMFAEAGATMEQLMKDPELMANVQKQIAANMGGAAMG